MVRQMRERTLVKGRTEAGGAASRRGKHKRREESVTEDGREGRVETQEAPDASMVEEAALEDLLPLAWGAVAMTTFAALSASPVGVGQERPSQVRRSGNALEAAPRPDAPPQALAVKMPDPTPDPTMDPTPAKTGQKTGEVAVEKTAPESVASMTAEIAMPVAGVDEPPDRADPEDPLPTVRLERSERSIDGTSQDELARLVVVHDHGRIGGRDRFGKPVDFVLTNQAEVRLPDIEPGRLYEISRISRNMDGGTERARVDVDGHIERIPASLFVEGPQTLLVGARDPADTAPIRLLRMAHVWLDTRPPEVPTFFPAALEVTADLLGVSNLEDRAHLQYRAVSASDWVTAVAGSVVKGPLEVRQVDRAGNAGPASEVFAHQWLHVQPSLAPISSDTVL